MKFYGGGGKHSGKRGSSAGYRPPEKNVSPELDDFTDIDEIVAEHSAASPASSRSSVQEMREYVPDAPAQERSVPARQSGYAVIEDDDSSVIPKASPVRPASPASGYTPDAEPPRIRGYVKPSTAPVPQKKKKQTRKRRWPLRVGITAVVLAALYCLCVFSNIPFIAKWRAIYIETAMGTMTHQWLATAFIPMDIIEDVMYERWKMEEQQPGIESDNSLINPSATTIGTLRPQVTTAASTEAAATTQVTTTATTAPPVPEWEKDDYPLYTAFPELDRESFIAYANENAETLYTEDGHILIDEAGRDQEGTSILTVHGDQVLALDTQNGILIVKVTGEGYQGKLALVRDAAQVKLSVTKLLGEYGSQLHTLAEKEGAILAINASGFADDNGHGTGGHPYGLVISDGELIQNAMGGRYKTIAFDTDNILNITNYKSSLDLRDGVEFRPALIVDGKIQVEGSAGWGVDPRSAIGQTSDGTVLMLSVDGRQTHSLGTTLGECAIILQRYGAVQACNLDGGSSSALYYNGRVISNPSGADKTNGRYIPDAFVVLPASTDTSVEE